MDTLSSQQQNELARHPMQSFEWGEARKRMGVRVEKIIEDDSIFQLTLHPIPYTSFTVGYVPRSVLPSEGALKKLWEFGNKNNALFIKLEPYAPGDGESGITSSTFTLVKSHHPLFPEWTQTLSLLPDERELQKNLKPKTRYNARLAEKKGVTVKELSNDEGYQIFEKLYFETCKRQGYHGHTPYYHRTLWNSLKDTQAHILVAFLGETPLAAYELLLFKKRLYYLYGGSSLAHKNVMAPNLLMWEAIRWGKTHGAEDFDMWGSLPPDYSETHPWAGFTRFKEGYGTKFTHLAPSFDLVIHPILYAFYGVAYTLREKLLLR